MKAAHRIVGLAVLVTAQLAIAQQQKPLSIGETKLDAGAQFTFGYNGAYGDAVQSNHGLNLGFDGTVSGFYYNPNFLSFSAHPYYDQSRANSDFQSLTNASGVTGAANFFAGSHFPGAVNYNYSDNSSGTFGLPGQPNFTTVGKNNGFGINWSALLPNLPTLAVGYSQGTGTGNLYGTDQESNATSRMFTLHSGYGIAGFRLTGYFNHNSLHSEFPEFLAGASDVEQSSGHDFGFGAVHTLPEHGSFSASYSRASETTNFLSSQEQTSQAPSTTTSNESSYQYSNETANAVFHPTAKFSWNASQSYADNLAGDVVQSLGNTGAAPLGLNFGPGSYSLTVGGGANYSFTDYLNAGAQATYYSQHYFGQSHSGEFLSGNLSYAGRLWNMFSFSTSVIDSSSDLGNNAVGFTGNVNFFRRFGAWSTSASFSYGQNVQTLLFTYTTSSYGYGATVARRLPGGLLWGATFGGGHSGLEQQPGNSTHSETYSTYLSMRRMSISANYGQSNGISLLGSGGLVTVTPIPGLTNQILYSGSNYGGGISVTPVRRLSISGTFSRSISDTIAALSSNNNTQVFTGQMQYHLRRIGLQAGYLRFTQGISAIGAPATSTSFFVGFTRWFNFF
jgi:hypothetical protein